LKGHAFVVFESHRVAKRVVATIDGHKFQGKELRAKLTKEGVKPIETFYQEGYLSPDLPGQNSERSLIKYSNCDKMPFLLQQPAMWVAAKASIKEYEAA
jgi:RNA recognition motif-containing protein